METLGGILTELRSHLHLKLIVQKYGLQAYELEHVSYETEQFLTKFAFAWLL